MSKPQKVAIFDFDGTIADTFDLGVAFIRTQGPRYGVKLETYVPRKHTMEENIALSKMSFLQIYFMHKAAKKYIASKLDVIPLFTGMDTQLKNLKNQQISVIIISSNSNEVIHSFLVKHKLDHLVDHIISGSSLFGKHKLINSSLKKMGIPKKNAVYVGDEVRDVKATKKSQIKMIAVEWGWDSKDNLHKSQPEYFCQDIHSLSQVVLKSFDEISVQT